MPHPSEPTFLVVHGLRLKGVAPAPVVADVVGLDLGVVAARLASLRSLGLATPRAGRASGWALTPTGRRHHARSCRDELVASGSAVLVESVYRRFVALNGPVLEACTDWQLRSDAPDGAPLLNDHEDNAYDAAVVGRLIDLDRTVQPLVAELGSAIARFGRYGGRLAFARSRIESGDGDWFTGAMIESYHTVWFELHEDLVATLGIDRFAEERAHAGSH